MTEARPFGCPSFSQVCAAERRSYFESPTAASNGLLSNDEGTLITQLEPDVVERQRRAAQNQSLFREINERIRMLEASFNTVAPAATSAFSCECANEACFERIAISHREYDAIREDGARFLIAAGDDHVWPDVERITEQNDQYWIVEKMGEAKRLARHFDPRSRSLRLATAAEAAAV